MCCGNFWKRIVPFLLAFLLGLFISNLFALFVMPLELLEKKVSPPKLENPLPRTEKQTSYQIKENLKCVPADPNLKYHQLSDIDLDEPLKLDIKPEEINEGIKEEMKKLLKDLRKKRERKKELRKLNDFTITTKLLYIEKCSEVK